MSNDNLYLIQAGITPEMAKYKTYDFLKYVYEEANKDGVENKIS